MALASIILNVIEKPSGGAATPYSWLSKAKASGMNKHGILIFATLLSYWWRRL